MLTTEAGPGGLLLSVVAPLSLLGSGIWLSTGDTDGVTCPIVRRAEI